MHVHVGLLDQLRVSSAADWVESADSSEVVGWFAGGSPAAGEAIASALVGYRGRVTEVWWDDYPSRNGFYSVEDVSATHAGDDLWDFSLSMNRVAGAAGRAEGTYRGGRRGDWPLVHTGSLSQWRPWVAVPSAAQGVQFPTSVDGTFERTGPGGAVRIGWNSSGSSGVYNGGIVTFSLPPSRWSEMGARVVDAAGIPVTRRGQELPSGWALDNGVTRWSAFDGGFLLRAPKVSDPSLWNAGFVLKLRVNALFGMATTVRSWLIDPGPQEAVIGVEMTGAGETLIMTQRLRRGARGVTVEGRSGVANSWGWFASQDVDATVVMDSSVVARRTSTPLVDGSRLLIVPMSAESLHASGVVYESGTRQRTAWHLATEFGGSSAATGDTAANLVRQAWGAAGESARVGQ